MQNITADNGTASVPLYWQTRFGSIVERQADPDADGWMTVMRLRDGAIREWNVRDMHPLTDAEALDAARAELESESVRETQRAIQQGRAVGLMLAKTFGLAR